MKSRSSLNTNYVSDRAFFSLSKALVANYPKYFVFYYTTLFLTKAISTEQKLQALSYGTESFIAVGRLFFSLMPS